MLKNQIEEYRKKILQHLVEKNKENLDLFVNAIASPFQIFEEKLHRFALEKNL